ncbi:tyrosine-type recombinase/integrase [Bartonella sp. DGB2]|uniref:tyrosine-type recombinase/integrase n=1 Tax=Bartonella sp. DGB2 TaxID=3388426 RepID=UPI0039900EB4
MPKPRPPHLVREHSRHGKVLWYVRINKGQRIRVEGAYGTQEFVDNYKSAIAQLQGQTPITIKGKRNAEGSFSWLLNKYYKSMEWHKLAAPTKRQRELILEKAEKDMGHVPYKALKRQHFIDAVERRKETPAAAKNFLKAFRGVFNWAIDHGFLEENPTLAIKTPALTNKEGFAIWLEDDIDKYYQRWPLGTHERVWIDVLLYTGLRRGDAVRIGWKDVTDGVIHLKTEKSQFQTDVFLHILPELEATLKAGTIGNDTFICGKEGRPLTKESFGNLFREACNEAGIKKSAHGLRKLAATRAANSGATVAQLKAIFGWTNDEMASHYTQNADRRRLALEAIEKIQKR